MAAKNFHVYILTSKLRSIVKVGKANSKRRTLALIRMGYADATGWKHVASFPVLSDSEAVALESMIIARLDQKGMKVPRLQWTNLVNGRPSLADECFQCTVDEAIETAEQMLNVLRKHVCA